MSDYLEALGKKKREVDSFEDPLQHLWAVSYADLLMVMLAFFVVIDVSPKDAKAIEVQKPGPVASVVESLIPKLSGFFFGKKLGGASPDSAASEVLEPIEVVKPKEATGVANKGEAASESINLTLDHETLANGPVNPLYQVLKEKNLGSDITISNMAGKNEILVHFNKDSYPPGKYQPTMGLRKKLKRVLFVLSPERTKLALSFIGHSDSLPVKDSLKRKGVLSNMVLSSMRSAIAADIAVEMGFEPLFVRTEGTGSFGRNSRSLTLRVTERTK